MARLSKKLAANVEGAFYVDSTCIDCDTCRWMAPETFSRKEEQSYVSKQPVGAVEKDLAWKALLSCPTASIGTIKDEQKPDDLRDLLPVKIDGPVYHNGYHAESSFGATSYFIKHPSGNILVDSPRFNKPLVKRLHELGGLRWMFLTHIDDVADHEKFQREFKLDRIIHEDDAEGSLRKAEVLLSGHDDFKMLEKITIIPVPGHTKGHCVMHMDDRYLFTGDHMAWSVALKHLYAFRRHCWYSWKSLIESSERLLNLKFEWVLPGHGRRYQAKPDNMRSEIQRAIKWMRTVA